jgi:predicted RNA binding protein YcfA (HicA-like mRNA interferase family)
VLSWHEIIKVLRKEGFIIVGQKGSHLRLKKKTEQRAFIVTLPKKKEIKPGTLMSIIKQSGYTKQEFLRLFK